MRREPAEGQGPTTYHTTRNKGWSATHCLLAVSLGSGRGAMRPELHAIVGDESSTRRLQTRRANTPLPHAPAEDRYTASTTAGHTAIIVGGQWRASLTAHPRQRMRKRVPLGTTESHSTELHAYKGDKQLRCVEMADVSASHRCGWCST
jgi:hypothetical protein